jgi:two-component system response regulator
MTTKRHVLLVVDDEPDNLKLFRLALARHPDVKEVKTFADPRQALRYLHDCRAGTAGQLPALVFLDINMPGTNGFQLLRQMRSEEVIRRVPVVMFTTSGEESDVAASYELGANSFIRKSIDFDVFTDELKEIINYWLVINELPF